MASEAPSDVDVAVLDAPEDAPQSEDEPDTPVDLPRPAVGTYEWLVDASSLEIVEHLSTMSLADRYNYHSFYATKPRLAHYPGPDALFSKEEQRELFASGSEPAPLIPPSKDDDEEVARQVTALALFAARRKIADERAALLGPFQPEASRQGLIFTAAPSGRTRSSSELGSSKLPARRRRSRRIVFEGEKQPAGAISSSSSSPLESKRESPATGRRGRRPRKEVAFSPTLALEAPREPINIHTDVGSDDSEESEVRFGEMSREERAAHRAREQEDDERRAKVRESENAIILKFVVQPKSLSGIELRRLRTIAENASITISKRGMRTLLISRMDAGDTEPSRSNSYPTISLSVLQSLALEERTVLLHAQRNLEYTPRYSSLFGFPMDAQVLLHDSLARLVKAVDNDRSTLNAPWMVVATPLFLTNVPLDVAGMSPTDVRSYVMSKLFRGTGK
jgi:hypothetical protein